MNLSSISNNPEYLKPSLQTECKKQEDPSIFNKIAQDANNFGENQSKGALFHHKLEFLLKNYKGITVQDIEQIQQKLGFDTLNLEKLDEAKIDKIIEHIKATLDKSIVDGVVDLKLYEKNVKAFKDRYDALNQGIVGFLIKKGYLKKSDIKSCNTISEIPDELLKSAVEAFLTDTVNELKTKSGKITPEQLQKQMESFKTLLEGTDEKDRARIWDAAKEFFAKNDTAKDALTEMFKSYATPEHLQKFVNKISEEDLEVLGINRDELITALRNVADSENPDAILNTMAAIHTKIKEFYQKNQEIINNCKIKVDEYKAKFGLNKDLELSEEILKTILSEEELKIYRTQNNLTNMFSGTTVGCAEKDIKITQDMQDSMQEIPDDFKEDMYERLEAYLKEHKDEFNIKEEDIEKYFNKLTNGEYGTVTGHTSESTNSSSGQSSEYGFSVNNNASQIINSSLAEKIQELYSNNNEKNKITIEKNNPQNTKEVVKNHSIIGLSAVDIANGVKIGLFTYQEAMKAISDAYYKATSSAKDMLAAYVKQMSNSKKAGFLSGIGGSALVDIIQKTKIDPEKLKLKTDYNTRKALEKIEEQEKDNNIA